MSWSGTRVKVLRLRLGWSQAELGRRLGHSHKIIESWECGRGQAAIEDKTHLENLESFLESQGEWIENRPRAEFCLNSLKLSQVKTSDLTDQVIGFVHSESN